MPELRPVVQLIALTLSVEPASTEYGREICPDICASPIGLRGPSIAIPSIAAPPTAAPLGGFGPEMKEKVG